MFEDEGHGSIELLIGSRRAQEDSDAIRQAQLDAGRRKVDAARLGMTELAAAAVALIGLRLAGEPADWDGRRITDERIDMALTVLDRIGIPKLRATAIAASIAAAPTSAAPGSPGWVPPTVGGPDEAEELDVGTVDAQISAFLEGAFIARDLGRDEK